MCTTLDDSLNYFDLDLLFSSAPTSTENTSITKNVHEDQDFSVLESTDQASLQNERYNEATINYKVEYIKILRCLQEKNKDYEQILNCLQEKNKDYDELKRCSDKKNKDYDQLKQQYIKLGDEFADLHYESKKNALEAINANNNFEKLTEELKVSHHKLIAIENQYSATNTMHQAAMSHNNQLIKLVEKLESDAANLMSMKQSYKDAIKEEKRNNSTLKSKITTYEAELCSIAGKLDRATDKKNRDRETQRQITKYTKKKCNADLESIDSQSVDTGRGSSFSMYSPAYSINFSPLNMTEHFEQKMMKDASTSPRQTSVTFNLSKHSMTSPTRFEVTTEPLENENINIDSTKKDIKTVDTASSPISFVEVMEKITTLDTASSPISFVDMEKVTTVDTASSPISFVDVMEKIKTVDTASSPISFVDVMEKIKTVDTAISPISFVDVMEQITTVNSPSSPISFSDNRCSQEMAKTKLSDMALSSFSSDRSPVVREKKVSPKSKAISPIHVAHPLSPAPKSPSRDKSASPKTRTPLKSVAATSPVFQTPEMIWPLKPAPVTSPVGQTPETTKPQKPDAVTSPAVQNPDVIKPLKLIAVTSAVVQAPEITRLQNSHAVTSPAFRNPEIARLFKPVAVTSPVLKAPELTRLQNTAAVTSPAVQNEQITKSFKPVAVTSPVVQAPDITRLLQSSDVMERSIDKTIELSRSLNKRPTVETSEVTMQLKSNAVTKHADLFYGPIDTNDVKRKSLITKISEMANPIETTDFSNQELKTTSESLVNNKISVISKTPNVTQLINAAELRKSVIQSPSITMKHADLRRSQTKTKKPIETKQNENIQCFSSEKSYLKEIRSNIAPDDEQERNDLEIRMILNNFRLDWNALSPMSITPELDEEDLIQSKSIVRNDVTERESMEHSSSQISNESDSLLVITPEHKKLTNPQNKSNKKLKINEDYSSHIKKNNPLKRNSIRPTRHVSDYNENKRQSAQSDKTMQLRKREAAVEIYKKYIKSNTEIKEPQSLSALASNISSLVPISELHNIQHSESKTLPHSSSNQLTQSQESPKKEYLLRSKQKKLSTPPEKLESEKIKPTITTAQSKTTKSVPLTHMRLRSNPIDSTSISKLSESNTHISPPIITNPEYGRKRTICTSMEAQTGNINSKRRKNSECDTSKSNSAENCIEDTYSFSKIPIVRVSRINISVSNNTSVANNNQSQDISQRKTTKTINKDLSNTPTSKRAKLADESTGFMEKPDQNINEKENTKMSTSSLRSTKSNNPEASLKSTTTAGTKNNNPEANLKSETTAGTKNNNPESNLKSITTSGGKNNNPEANLKSRTTAGGKNNKLEANLKNTTTDVTTCTVGENNHHMPISHIEQSQNEHGRFCADYNDINIFNTDSSNVRTHSNQMNEKDKWSHNLLHKMIYKYGANLRTMNKSSKNNDEIYEEQIAKQIENAVAKSVNVFANRDKYYKTIQEAAAELEEHTDIPKFCGGFMKYVKSPDRKAEFLPANKNRNYWLKPTPTIYVMSLIDIIGTIDRRGLNIWEPVMETCRYVLFNLDKQATPTLDVVENVTHLFVSMCQCNLNSKALVMFMMAAMYCGNYRAIVIIKLCLELAPEILPHQNERPHNSMTPLLQTFLFLLHFNNCDDPLKKAQDLRYRLVKRYGYDATQENDTTLLFKLKQTLVNINDNYFEKDMLELAFLILAKRKGTKWCHKNIVQKILIPVIRGETSATSAAFRFSLTIITKLLKPYNSDMSIHVIEVLNLLMNILEQPHPQELQEDILCGLMYINVQSLPERINHYLLNWNPPCISPKFEQALKKYVESKPLKHWKFNA